MPLVAIRSKSLLSLLALLIAAGCAEGGTEEPGGTPARGETGNELPPDGSITDATEGDAGNDTSVGDTLVDAKADGAAEVSTDAPAGETCGPPCSLGVKICDGNALRTCETIGGCNTFGAPLACPGGTVCNASKCDLTCTNACPKAGDVQCSGSGALQTCGMQASGCLDWSAPVACPTGEVCSGGKCAPSCTNQCAAGAAKCAGADSFQTCAMQPSGCTDWSPAALCPGSGSCTGAGTCVACAEGTKRCGAAGGVEECKSAVWTALSSCPLGCSAGACVASVACTAGAYRCNGLGVEICSSAGTAWLPVSTCAVGCTNGLCTGACRAGAKRCNGADVETCDANGIAWSKSESCSAGCDASTAQCALASLTVTSETRLDGVVVVDGPVVVTAGGTILSPKGDLTIRAKSIAVNNGGGITAAQVGSVSVLCSSSVASGGAGGLTPGVANNAVATPGNAGATGGCRSGIAGRGGRGGGVIRLIADRIEIDGVVRADGENGGSASSGIAGGGGGGSGGTILLAANTLRVTGNLSAAPGIGGTGTGAGAGNGTAGRPGRLKLFHGTLGDRVLTGSRTGDQSLSLIPPLRITSSTHPDPERWYNDDFADVVLAWDRPWPTRDSYYWELNTQPSKVPTDATGRLHREEVLGIPGNRFVAGANYFHIISQDALANLGTVENIFQINVNKTPPTVASTSHPNQTAWAGINNNPRFTWTVPNGDQNYVGVHWVLDRYGDTVPTRSDTFREIANKSLQLSDLADGIWCLHVVSVDTRGYLTKAADHYRVRIGTDPGTGGILGKVVDANSVNVANALVTINRGLLRPGIADVRTNADGVFNIANVPAGTWEIQVTRGTSTRTQSVTVTRGGTASATITF
jgi:hypothetical protein